MDNGVGFQSYEDIYKSYLAQFSSGTPVFENVFRGMARIQLEYMGLANRRTQALLEIPSRLAQCRNPQEFGEEQVRFWRTAGEQYLESTERIMSAWQQMMSPAMFDMGRDRESGDFNGAGGRSHIRLVRSADRDVERTVSSRSRGGSSNGAHRSR